MDCIAPASFTHTPPDDRPSWQTQALAVLVLLGGLFLYVCCLAGGSWDGERAPFPYVWRDVALVQLFCALPLALASAAFLAQRVSRLNLIGLAVVFLGGGIVPLLGAGASLGAVGRALPALGLTLSVALLAAVLKGDRRAPNQRTGWGYRSAVAGLGLAVLLGLPSLYVSARCRHDVGRLGQLLDQSRFGEARTLVHGLLALGAEGEWQGHPLPAVAAEVDRMVGVLESRVAVSLSARASDRERLERARELAMLGRTEAALDVLPSVRDPALTAEAASLRGTIHETRDEWDTALAAHQSARQAWQGRPESPAREAGLLQATRDIAYCQRKLGRYTEAEAAYLQLLKLSPTNRQAEAHFLLAQFYEDAQQAEQARVHARRAVAHDPARYGQAGEQLIRKLTVFHFGCVGVFSAENERPKTSLVPLGATKTP
ncbi:MAG: tetratricopeptide repeat protein [Gemmataceae bacterium]|nr:tetratricopeptide repeat protein [Gemmataceae bacterium]